MGTLEAILRELVPVDEPPGAEAWLGALVARRVEGLDALLERLQGFEALEPLGRLAVLEQLDAQGDPAFARLVEAALEAFYADPRSWPAIGYATHLPGRP